MGTSNLTRRSASSQMARSNAALVFMSFLAMASAEEEEAEASPVDLAVAATLISCVVFQMLLFYLLNNSDKDIRKYTYLVLNQTVSIFCAILLFQALNKVLETYVLHGLSEFSEMVFDFFHMLTWFVILQVALAKMCGIIGGVVSTAEKVEVNCKCWGTLLGHITGFAGINAFGALQNIYLKESILFFPGQIVSFLALPIAIVTMSGILKATDKVREHVAKSDGTDKDWFERLWDKEAEETEAEVFGLVISFMTVQSCRYLISGHLPNAEGHQDPAILFYTSGFFGGARAICLYALGGGFLVLTMAFHWKLAAKKKEEEENEEEEDNFKERLIDIACDTVSMGFAWSWFYANQAFLAASPFFSESNQTTLGVTEAVALSVGCFICIFFLDKLADAEWTSSRLDKVIVQVVLAFAFLVGFSWEQCFDVAVVSLSSTLWHPHLVRLLLAIGCAALLIPAWKWYLLPMLVTEGYVYGFLLLDHHYQEVDGVDGHSRMIAHLEERKAKREESAVRQTSEGYVLRQRLLA